MRVTAVLTLRNEGPFLLEWLAHHRAVGFTDILVFSNDCDDGTDRMLDRLQDMGWLTHVPNPGPWPEGPQWAALKAADRHPLVKQADWVMVIDIDEFVNIHLGDRTLAALMGAHPQADAFVMTWRMFGNNGIQAMEDAPVTATFTAAAPAQLWWPWRASMVKTLFRTNGIFRKLGVHRPRNPDDSRLSEAHWLDGSGRRLPPDFVRRRLFTMPGQDCVQQVQLNHYALGSMEGYLVKADRGRANRAASGFDVSYWVERNICAVNETSIAAMAPRSAPILAALMDDSVLGPLHRAAFSWRQARFQQLMREEPWQALYGRLLMTPPARILSETQARAIWNRPSLV